MSASSKTLSDKLLTFGASIADQFAANGYLAVVPDIYEGDNVPLNRPDDFNIMAWGGRHMPPTVDPILTAMIHNLRSNFGVKKLGGVGYCFGAKYVARFLGKGIDAGAMAHPSFVAMEEIKAIGGPLTIAAAETDHIFPEEKRHETEKILKEWKKTYQMILYSGVEHGFAVRADLSQREVKFAQEATLLQQLQWFDEWLKE